MLFSSQWVGGNHHLKHSENHPNFRGCSADGGEGGSPASSAGFSVFVCFPGNQQTGILKPADRDRGIPIIPTFVTLWGKMVQSESLWELPLIGFYCEEKGFAPETH